MQKKFNRTIFLSLIATAILGGQITLQGCQPTPEEKPLNVLVILADDLGYYDLSHTGSSFYETPNLDRLAKMSMDFRHGYANSPVCSPARASLMTGQFPSRHGITDWIGALTGEEWRSQNRHTRLLPPENKMELSQEHETLAEAMQSAGYTTFIAGKWHLGDEGSSPEDHGFDINKGGWRTGTPIGGYFDPFQNPKLENRKPGEHLSIRLADETVSFMRNQYSSESNNPFFAYLSFYAVHSPLQTSRELWQKYRDKADSLGLAEQAFEMGRYLPVRIVQDNPLYAGLLETMDDAIGLVLDGLEESGLLENTIIVFTSDHGGVSSGDAFATSNLPFRKGKGSTFEGGLRVPFFVYVPDQTKPGSYSDTPVTIADLYPTILDLTNQQLREEQHKDGKSLVSIFQGNEFPERALYWHYPHYSNQDGRPSSVIRMGNWKLIYDYETEESELYNLQTDPSESKNLSQMYPQRTIELYDKLMAHLEETGAKFPVKDSRYNPEAEQRHLTRVKENRMANLERRRMMFLSPDFDPENNWWGSQIE